MYKKTRGSSIKTRGVQLSSLQSDSRLACSIPTESVRNSKELRSSTTNHAAEKKNAVFFAMFSDTHLDEQPPVPPYAEECYFALNTYRSSSTTLPAAKLFRAIDDFLQSAPLVELRLKKKRDWELQYEFFHRDRKIEFSINFFEDNVAPQMGSCLVETHRISGDHEPFQHLAEIIRQQYEVRLFLCGL